MKAMILAAGRGERLRPLTDSRPKPMVEVAGKPLIAYQVERLVRAGFHQIVVNTAYLGEQIEQFLGTGTAWGVEICYSHESEALETAGGIAKALPLLGERFVVVNADIWTTYDYSHLLNTPEALAHLVLVPNPPHKSIGDFGLDNASRRATLGSDHTFSGIGVYQRELFSGIAVEKRPLAPILRDFIAQRAVTGEVFDGAWVDVGTKERLKQATHLAQTQQPK